MYQNRGVYCLAVMTLVACCQLHVDASEDAMETAKRLHQELDQLHVEGNLEKQLSYFSDNVVRIDPNRPISQGKDSWLGLAKSQDSRGVNVLSAKTTVIDAWNTEGRIYEYGTSQLKIQRAEAAASDDPVAYFAIWNVASDPQLEFIIWNTAQPVKELELLAGLSKRASSAPSRLRRHAKEQDALEVARSLHERLDRLQVSGGLEEQRSLFADDVIRLDPNRPISRGKASWRSSMESMQSSGVKIVDSKTNVIDAWRSEGRIYEFGTSQLKLETAGGGGGDDPTAFFAIWDVASEPQLKFIIWNTTQPVGELKLMSTVGR